MNTEYQFNESSPEEHHQDVSHGNLHHTNELTGAMDMVKRERFELLSAYLDGEVTVAEKKLVEEWLADDADVKQLYVRLLKVRQGMRSIPVPASQEVGETVDQVLIRLRRRTASTVLFGGAVLAASCIALISGIFPIGESRIPQLARNPVEEVKPKLNRSTTVALSVSLNQPVVPIPKSITSTDKAAQ